MNKFLRLISIICCLVFLLSLTANFTVFADNEEDAASDTVSVDMLGDTENQDTLPADMGDNYDDQGIPLDMNDMLGTTTDMPLQSGSSVPGVAVSLVYIVICLALILIVLLQSGRQAGLSGSIAGGAETFFGKNKGRTIDAILGKWTSACAILFMLIAIVLNFLLK